MYSAAYLPNWNMIGFRVAGMDPEPYQLFIWIDNVFISHELHNCTPPPTKAPHFKSRVSIF